MNEEIEKDCQQFDDLCHFIWTFLISHEIQHTANKAENKLCLSVRNFLLPFLLSISLTHLHRYWLYSRKCLHWGSLLGQKNCLISFLHCYLFLIRGLMLKVLSLSSLSKAIIFLNLLFLGYQLTIYVSRCKLVICSILDMFLDCRLDQRLTNLLIFLRAKMQR